MKYIARSHLKSNAVSKAELQGPKQSEDSSMKSSKHSKEAASKESWNWWGRMICHYMGLRQEQLIQGSPVPPRDSEDEDKKEKDTGCWISIFYPLQYNFQDNWQLIYSSSMNHTAEVQKAISLQSKSWIYISLSRIHCWLLLGPVTLGKRQGKLSSQHLQSS